MFFKTFATIAAVAFGALSVVAAPTSESLVQRADPSSIPQIISDLTSAVQPSVQALNSITAANATVAVIQPIVNNLQGELSSAVSQVNELAGQPASVILASVDGTAQVTAQELAQILSNLLHLVLGALGAVFTIANSIGATSVISLLSGVGGALGALLSAVLALVAVLLTDVVAILDGLIGDLSGIISGLGITSLISALGLNLGGLL